MQSFLTISIIIAVVYSLFPFRHKWNTKDGKTFLIYTFISTCVLVLGKSVDWPKTGLVSAILLIGAGYCFLAAKHIGKGYIAYGVLLCLIGGIFGLHTAMSG